MKAVIMAGGEGARLRPLTNDRPKPLVPVCNRPVIGYTLDLLASHGFQEVFLTMGYMPAAISGQFGDRYRGMRLRYRVEERPLGTAGGVAALRHELDETFLVISGDALTDADLTALLAFHRRSGALATLGLARVENPLEYGVVMTDRRGRIRRFLEKPGWGEVFSDTVNTGIYVLEPAALDGVPPRRHYDFSRQLFPALMQMDAPLHGTVLDGYWCDIGDPTSYLRANLDVLAGRLRFRPPGEEVAPGVWASAPIGPDVRLEGPVLVGEGCRMAPGAHLYGGVVLGPATVVGRGCTITRSVTWSGVHLEAGATLIGAVVCQGAALGEESAVYDGAVVGQTCSVGERASVAPGVRLWPGSQVEDGAVAERTLVRSSRWTGRWLRQGCLTGRLGQDLFPEQALRVGTAFAALQGRGGPVVVGSDPGGGPGLVRQSLICGIVAAGRDVLDAGVTAAPVTAFTCQRVGASGGLHVLSGGGHLRVRFYNEEGRPAGRELLRRLEQACQQQEYLWRVTGETGQVRPEVEAERQYLDYVAESVGVEGIKKAAPAVRLTGEAWPLLYRWLDRLGCRVAAEGGEEPEVAVEPLEGGWRLAGVDPGRMLALHLWLQVRAQPSGEEIPVPPTASPVLEGFLRRQGRRPVPVRLSDWQPTDPILGVTLLLDWLAREGLTVQAALATLPQIHTARGMVPCPWQAKGRVMRRLAEEYQDGLTELFDGLRIARGDASALLLPDPDEACYQILAEGESPEEAEALLERLAQRVSRLVAERG